MVAGNFFIVEIGRMPSYVEMCQIFREERGKCVNKMKSGEERNCYNNNIANRYHKIRREEMLSGRQISIAKLLYSQERFITYLQIAQHVGVSPKTVRNDLTALREFCQEYRVGAVLTKPHEGVMIQFTKEEWEQFLGMHQEEIPRDGSQVDIRCMVIRLLLKKQTVNYGELERSLFASRAAIEKELVEVKKWFQSHDILFEKKRGKGLEIFYNEFHYRMAMWQFLGYWKNMQKLGQEKVHTEQEMTKMLLDGFDTGQVETAICELEQVFGYAFSYESHQQLLFLLSLMISRVRKKLIVEMQDVGRCRTDSPFDERLAAWLLTYLEKHYHFPIPAKEQEFLRFLVRISDIQGFSDEQNRLRFENDNLELCCITMKLANLLGEIINVDLKSDVSFVESLMFQLRSTIQRLRYHIVWKHPLLKQVKQKYPDIYAAVYAAGVFFDKELGMEINEHEMCCLALLLGGAVERNISILTACVVCNYGIGVSQLLRERIERNIPDLRIQGVFSIRDIRKLRAAKCDFIIATLPMDSYRLERDVVVVEHLLPAYDVKKIGDKMKQIRKEKLKKRPGLGQVKLQKELFNREFIWLMEEAADKESMIRMLCRALLDAGYVTKEFEDSVFEHEEKAPTQLGRGVAIPHGYSKYVIRPVVACATLKHPVEWESGEMVDMIFLLAFNLDEASGLKEETIKFYSVFLDMLDNDEELNMVKQMTEAAALTNYMNQKVRGEKCL